MSVPVKTFTAYFGNDNTLYECFAWVESEKQLFTLLKEQFKVDEIDVTFKETHLFPNDEEPNSEQSPVPMLITQVYEKAEKTIKYIK